MSPAHLLIVGGGHAAATLCAALQEGGWRGRTTLVTEEAHLPYQRPPLSKGLIKDAQAPLPEIRAAAWYGQAGVELRLGQRVQAIEPAARRVTLQAGTAAHALGFDHLVLATGTRARRLPGLVPAPGNGVHELRCYEDALRLRDHLPGVQRLLVVGGGFIGLEIAATARLLGKQVTVAEAGARLLGRSASEALAAHALDAQRGQGVDVRLGARLGVARFDAGGRFCGAELDNEWLAADAVVVGVGAMPCVELAEQAGLACGNGVRVDEWLLSSDPAVSAIGDCANFPEPGSGRRLRLESVQNAQDQARTVAARLLGQPAPHAAVPWFWSEQGALRLQMAGLWRPGLRGLRRDGSRPGSFSIDHFEDERLVAVESVNAPMDHLAARKRLQAGQGVLRDRIAPVAAGCRPDGEARARGELLQIP